jgi:hypothetical protein
MSDEKLIAEAILQLKQESSVIKDYIFPIAMALFSSLIGAVVGYRVYLRQEKLTAEKRKLDILNRWILIADEIHQSLLALKFNYHGGLTSHPYQRFLAIPSIIGINKEYQFDYYELAFITDLDSNNKWLNVGYLRSLFSNYEALRKLWVVRNEYNERVRIEFFNSQSSNKAYVDLNDAEIELYINQANLSFLIDCTERCIRLTDDLITEFYNFFNEFPLAIKHKVDLNLIKNHGFIIAFDMERNEAIKPLLIDSPKPDYMKISQITGRSVDELIERYKPLFQS